MQIHLKLNAIIALRASIHVVIPHFGLCKLSQEEIDSLDHFLCSVNCEKLYKKGRK